METYLVGGAVRDQRLGLAVSERDWVVVGETPESMRAAGFRQVGRDFPVFLHPRTFEQHALARTERKAGVGHTAFVCHAGPEVTLEEDLKRRDLTVNAMARGEDGRLIDPWGGARDLEQRVLRHVSDAFGEDPLRVLRVARFLARFQHLGFSVAPETAALMRRMSASGELATLPAERVWQELEKALGTRSPAAFFRCLAEVGALVPWFAEIDAAAIATLETQWAAVRADAESRFACFGAALPEPAVASLARRLKVPNRHRDLADVMAQIGEALTGWRREPPETVLDWLRLANALRDPEPFERIARLRAALDHDDDLDALAALARRVQRAKAADAGVSGETGPAVGEALERYRLALIARAQRG